MEICKNTKTELGCSIRTDDNKNSIKVLSCKRQKNVRRHCCRDERKTGIRNLKRVVMDRMDRRQKLVQIRA